MSIQGDVDCMLSQRDALRVTYMQSKVEESIEEDAGEDAWKNTTRNQIR